MPLRVSHGVARSDNFAEHEPHEQLVDWTPPIARPCLLDILVLQTQIRRTVLVALGVGAPLARLALCNREFLETIASTPLEGPIRLPVSALAPGVSSARFLRWWWRFGCEAEGLKVIARPALNALITRNPDVYSHMLWTILQGRCEHDLWASGLHASFLGRWCGQSFRGQAASPGRSCVSLMRRDPAATPYLFTDGPVPACRFDFSVLPLWGPSGAPGRWPIEIRTGLVAWPFEELPPGAQGVHGSDCSVVGKLTAHHFKDGAVPLTLSRGGDGRLRLSVMIGDELIGSAARPLRCSNTGAYGAYIAHEHDRHLKYVLLSRGVESPETVTYSPPFSHRDYRLMTSRCPPTVYHGQFFRTKPSGSSIRCKLYSAPPRRGDYISTLPPDFVFGPVQEIVSAYGYVSVCVDGYWINVWKQGTHFATSM